MVFFSRLPCCALIFFALTLLGPYFSSRSRSALIFYALTLLCLYFSSHLPYCALMDFFSRQPGCALFFLAPTLPFFFSHLPCCALNFLRTYPAVPLWIFFTPTPTADCPTDRPIFLRTYPALHLFFFAHSSQHVITPSWTRRGLHRDLLIELLLFFFALNLLCPNPLFAYDLPCCALLILFSLTLLYPFPAFRLPLTLLHLYFSSHLPCCALIFLRD